MKLLLTTIKIFGLILILLIIYVLYLVSPTSFSNEKIRFVIPLETKQEEIIFRLKNENFIRSDKMFMFLTGLIKFPGNIEPGAYLLSRRMFTWQIANTLLNHPYQKWAVIVPGLRKEQIAEKLQTKFNWNDETIKDFINSANEGYLFPDTYLLNIDYTGKEVAQRMMANFNEKFDAQLQNDLLSQDVRNDTAIKIASLIERESGSDSDKPLIAGVIWNRLNKDMKLQIDATSQYIKGKSGNWWPIVTPLDHKADSPYNTYIYKGLPPTSIASPSLASIKAAVYPKDTDCFFYLHDRGKNIHCAVTYQEHLENIDTYLR